MRQGIDPLRLEIVGFGEFHPRQTNATIEGRNSNRRVVVLVLEQVSPGAPMTTIADEHTPGTAAAGVELSDGSTGANRLMYRVPPATLENSVLGKGQAQPPANEKPKADSSEVAQ
jgi:chemotaxis protein MotB